MLEANGQAAEYLKNVCGQVDIALDKVDERRRKSDDPASKDANIFKHLVLARIVDSLQPAGQLNRVDHLLEHV